MAAVSGGGSASDVKVLYMAAEETTRERDTALAMVKAAKAALFQCATLHHDSETVRAMSELEVKSRTEMLSKSSELVKEAEEAAAHSGEAGSLGMTYAVIDLQKSHIEGSALTMLEMAQVQERSAMELAQLEADLTERARVEAAYEFAECQTELDGAMASHLAAVRAEAAARVVLDISPDSTAAQRHHECAGFEVIA
jgi:hypothetical protein